METKTKPRINNISAVAIIFRKSDPSQVFIEMKDDGYPMAAFRRQLCFIGGNWIGENARSDTNPLMTARREIEEELSFDHAVRSSEELALLGMVSEVIYDEAARSTREVTDEDRQLLERLKGEIREGLTPFGDFILTVERKVLDRADPKNSRDGFSGLCSYYLSPISEESWGHLSSLQQTFGNLSNESVTLITSLGKIIETGTKTAFGHDQILQRFFLSRGLSEAENLPLVEGIASQSVGGPLSLYSEYLEQYDILKRPPI
ncbi:MAG: hypothetical protein AAB594_01535 [Patescibacteria group bacterium]